MPENEFHIRETCRNPVDGDFIIAAFDSALPHLASVGSGGQWGSTPFSERPEYRQRMYDCVPLSEASRLNEKMAEDRRLFIAEVDSDGRRLPVGAVFVRQNWWAEYIKTHEGTRSFYEAAKADGPFYYVEMLISDYRTGEARRGAGAVLLGRAREYAASKGARAMYLDCWAGNSGGLVRYYTRRGFERVADFAGERPDGTVWRGSLLKMEVGD